jgi:arylsulfatase A-like enzyme
MLDAEYESVSSLDTQLGRIVESMDNETILLVIAIGEANNDGLFALAAPNCPLAGEFEGADIIDLAPTLLDLAGYKIPDSIKGKSLVAGLEKKNPAESSGDDQLVQDRLSGLGYV